jgi:peptidoglycan/LPS O-acetylase OafA/YrhL
MTEHSKKPFFPNLDGLRFIAFLGVFLSHSFYADSADIKSNRAVIWLKEICHTGIVGVHLFFVLSGFLITYLMLDERRRNGFINIKAFYVRRTLRIWPLYFVIVFLGLFIIPYLMNQVGEPYHEQTKFTWYLFFVNNLYPVYPATAVLGVLWSIAVEEQFYLVWPWLITLVKPNRYVALFICLLIVSVIVRVFNLFYYEHTLYNISDLVLGSWLAWIAFNGHPLITKLTLLPKRNIVIIYIFGLLILFTNTYWNVGGIQPFIRLITDCFFTFIIAEQVYSRNSWYKISTNRFATFWGKYTYGLYMTHFVAIYLVHFLFKKLMIENVFHTVFTTTIIAFLLTLWTSYNSYHLFEKPFLKLKEKFSY